MLEAVPNVSEGRSRDVIDAVRAAFATSAHVLDVHSDADHHRSVYTLVGEHEPLVDALVAGTQRALELVDLRRHNGVHPRVGVVDVVPLVALAAGEEELAKQAALDVASRIGGELSLPVFLYGEIGEGRRPAFFRRGGLDELERRVQENELRPAFGPAAIDPRLGAVLVGARSALVAYNVELDTHDVEVARAIAALVRESSGGMPGVQAIGLALPRFGTVQVSMNLVDLDHALLHEVVQRVRREAESRGVAVAGGELVGLVPERVLAAASEAGTTVPGIDETRVLERRLRL